MELIAADLEKQELEVSIHFWDYGLDNFNTSQDIAS